MSRKNSLVGPRANLATEIVSALPLDEWEDTKNTLHRFAQIVGKIRLVSVPHMKYWWDKEALITIKLGE